MKMVKLLPLKMRNKEKNYNFTTSKFLPYIEGWRAPLSVINTGSNKGFIAHHFSGLAHMYNILFLFHLSNNRGRYWGHHR